MQYGLIGEKLGHSFSKDIHEKFGKYEYELVEIEKSALANFLTHKNFKGINVTIPYKESVIPYLDGISDQAKAIGAVNTVINRDGKLYGYNTDYYGFNYMLERANISVEDKVVALLGTGGASKMALFALEEKGAKEIVVVSRKGEVNYETIKERKDIQVIVNATPMGMYPNNGECLINPQDFPKLEGIADMVYNPYVTELLFRGQELGVKTVNGLSMLVAQAKRACEIFTGEDLSFSLLEDVIKKIEKSTRNITLIGMPGSGKTTLGKIIAKELDREFFDADEQFEKKIGVSAGEFIELNGEKAFREKETEVLTDLLKQCKKVISTGGGAVKKDENRKNIRSNSIVVWVNRKIDNLATGGRPLSKDIDAVKKLYEERADLYASVCDIIIENDKDIKTAVNSLLTKLNEF